MTARQDIVTVARRWIGTPYHHQASCEGAGCDCLGLIRGIWREVCGHEPEAVPAYSADWSEPQGHEALLEAATRWLQAKPRGLAAPGDVLLFRMRDGTVAKHLGIQSRVGAVPSFIHAFERHGVIESPLSRPWARRVVARFVFPEEKA